MPRCKSCGAEIRWEKTPAGKHMPMDPRPEKRIVLGRVNGLAYVVDTYMPHWATCTSADEHRRKP